MGTDPDSVLPGVKLSLTGSFYLPRVCIMTVAIIGQGKRLDPGNA